MRANLAMGCWILLLAAPSACINVTAESASRDQPVSSYVRRRPASSDQPGIAASLRGTNLAVAVTRQPLCPEDTVVVSQRFEQTTTIAASDGDTNTLAWEWIGGVLGVVAGGILVGIAPSLSNEKTLDADGKEQSSHRQDAYLFGGLGLAAGLPTVLAAVINTGRLGTSERKVGDPRSEVTGSRDVPCGSGQPVSNAEVAISGGTTSAAVGQTNARGRLEVDLRYLPKPVREEIASRGRLTVSTEQPGGTELERVVPNETAEKLRGEVAQQAREASGVALNGVAGGPAGPASASPESGVRLGASRGIVLKTCEIEDGQKGRAMGNGNGRIDRGELVEVTCQLENRGENLDYSLRLDVISERSDVTLSGLQAVERVGWPAERVAGPLALGQSVTFLLSVKKRYSLDESIPLPVVIRVARQTGQIVSDIPLQLYLGKEGTAKP